MKSQTPRENLIDSAIFAAIGLIIYIIFEIFYK